MDVVTFAVMYDSAAAYENDVVNGQLSNGKLALSSGIAAFNNSVITFNNV